MNAALASPHPPDLGRASSSGMTNRQADDQTPEVSELDVSHADEQDSVGTVNPAGLHRDPQRTELEELRANLADTTHEEQARLEEAEEEKGRARRLRPN
ncbi:hypothetical protein Dgeo_0858 [Deinococcus geothermalis DSM 11300]|uniref:Uncharacterized protein n=2 Tax=Deinococcaceae TaxID=183710 RepID=Q1J024_DEIGD|nr:hypothetical protein Dgeo_0858 [Deinococcus geothermalis DSM 11300]